MRKAALTSSDDELEAAPFKTSSAARVAVLTSSDDDDAGPPANASCSVVASKAASALAGCKSASAMHVSLPRRAALVDAGTLATARCVSTSGRHVSRPRRAALASSSEEEAVASSLPGGKKPSIKRSLEGRVARPVPARKNPSIMRSAREKPCMRRFAPGSIEYQKHAMYRRAHGFVDESGGWLYHPALGMKPFTPMPLRQWDVLHVIYLYLEQNGHVAASVDQIWALDQSLVRRAHRGETLSQETLKGKPPSIPGFRWRLASTQALCCSPCLLPRSRLFHNRTRTFIPASGMMQLNGIILSACPSWSQFPASALASGAGNAFSMTVATAHLVVAVMRLCRFVCPSLEWKDNADMQQQRMPEFALRDIVRFYVQRSGVSLAMPTPAASAASSTIRFGSLCSGTDFVAAIMPCIVQELREQNRALSPEIRSQQEFSAEMDAHMRDFSASNFEPALSVYTDVTKLPRSIREVQLLIFGSSCRGLVDKIIGRRRAGTSNDDGRG